MSEADFRQSRSHGFSVQSGVEVRLGFGGRDVPDRFEQTAVVEPVDPFKRGMFNGPEAAPRSPSMDNLDIEHMKGTVAPVGPRKPRNG